MVVAFIGASTCDDGPRCSLPQPPERRCWVLKRPSPAPQQFELDEVNANHQREMQDILTDAASKIKRFKEELSSKQGQLDLEARVSGTPVAIARRAIARRHPSAFSAQAYPRRYPQGNFRPHESNPASNPLPPLRMGWHVSIGPECRAVL